MLCKSAVVEIERISDFRGSGGRDGGLSMHRKEVLADFSCVLLRSQSGAETRSRLVVLGRDRLARQRLRAVRALGVRGEQGPSMEAMAAPLERRGLAHDLQDAVDQLGPRRTAAGAAGRRPVASALGSRHFWPPGSQRSSRDDSATRAFHRQRVPGDLPGFPGGLLGPGVQVDMRLVRARSRCHHRGGRAGPRPLLRHARAVTEDQADPPFVGHGGSVYGNNRAPTRAVTHG